jgi:hypothetical protein
MALAIEPAQLCDLLSGRRITSSRTRGPQNTAAPRWAAPPKSHQRWAGSTTRPVRRVDQAQDESGMRLSAAGCEALVGLAGDAADELKVFVEVQHGEADALGGGRDEQVGDGRPAVLAGVGQ